MKQVPLYNATYAMIYIMPRVKTADIRLTILAGNYINRADIIFKGFVTNTGYILMFRAQMCRPWIYHEVYIQNLDLLTF